FFSHVHFPLRKDEQPESESDGSRETRVDQDRPSDQLRSVNSREHQADERSPGNSGENADEPSRKVRPQDVERWRTPTSGHEKSRKDPTCLHMRFKGHSHHFLAFTVSSFELAFGSCLPSERRGPPRPTRALSGLPRLRTVLAQDFFVRKSRLAGSASPSRRTAARPHTIELKQPATRSRLAAV